MRLAALARCKWLGRALGRRRAGARGGSAKERELSWFDWGMVRDISPDGRQLLFDESGEGGGDKYATFLRGMDGAAPVRLTDGAGAAISPDGKSVLAVEVADLPRLKLIPVGAGEPRMVSTDSVVIARARWTNDGGSLLIRGYRRGEPARWWTMPAGGGKPTPIEKSEDAGRWIANSPDGKWVAFMMKGGKIRIAPLGVGAAGGGPARSHSPTRRRSGRRSSGARMVAPSSRWSRGWAPRCGSTRSTS